MKTALLFSGQGAQAVGMGKDLAANFPVAADLFAKADSILGYSLSQIAFEGPAEDLTRTSVCQPALYVHGFSVLAVLKERCPHLTFDAAAGLSLGEFTAHSAAGTFDFETGLRLVDQRSRFMQEACEATEGGMAAIIGAEEQGVRDLAAAADVDVANFNSPGQIVISGEKAKIALAVGMAKEYGARKAVELTVAGAFHSRLMEPAYQRLSAVLAETSIVMPSVPVVSNIDARPAGSPDAIRQSLADQVTGSVCWTASIEYMIDHLGITRFLELGPGGVIAGLVGRIRKGTEVISIADTASLEAALATLSA
ncbi:MAG: ACP S-malonyltransferase [Chthoniobacterales bacterium]|nr:ACP S-malonyltransferase [Chthoniobacterales bacterium]